MYIKIKDFINENNWCQRALAMDAEGNKLNWVYGGNAIQFCITGMVLFCYRGDEEKQKEIIDKLKEKVGHWPTWNDRPERTWEDIRALAQELDI